MADTLTEVVVLAEDSRQYGLAYRYLRKCGYLPHQIIKVIAPRGEGSGEQYVRESYAKHVRALRNRTISCALVVIIDADNLTMAQRQRQLAAALDGSRLQGRDDRERIALLIPKRNVETWLFCLLGEIVGETDNYRDRNLPEDWLRTTARTLFNWTRPNTALPDHCVASLRDAIETGEFARLEQ